MPKLFARRTSCSRDPVPNAKFPKAESTNRLQRGITNEARGPLEGHMLDIELGGLNVCLKDGMAELQLQRAVKRTSLAQCNRKAAFAILVSHKPLEWYRYWLSALKKSIC